MKVPMISLFAAITLSVAACAVTELPEDNDDIEVGDEEGDEENDNNDDNDDNDIEELPIAPLDNDSLAAPAESHFLRITGTREFTFQNDISTDVGDASDFVEFEFPNNSNPSQSVFLTLDCNIIGEEGTQVRATIYEDGERTLSFVSCNEGEQRLTVDNTKVQTVAIEFSNIPAPAYADYTLTVVGFR